MPPEPLPTELGDRRLLQLADFLEYGQLGHQVFDFSCFNADDSGRPAGPQCGFAGCALGECPILWPEDWRFDPEGSPLLREYIDAGPELGSSLRSARKWFRLDHHQVTHLFVPTLQKTHLYGGHHLDRTASRQAVAANIRAFVEQRQKGLCT